MSPLSIQKLDINLWDLKNKNQLYSSENYFNLFVRNKIKLKFKKINVLVETQKNQS